jgi:hypothetical protein
MSRPSQTENRRWAAGVIALTFFGSFKDTTRANGYFGAWFSFIFVRVYIFESVGLCDITTISSFVEHGLN